MASTGVHTNGSQFYIDLTPAPHLNGRCVVFGRIIEGDDVLKEIEKVMIFHAYSIELVTFCALYAVT